jgi:hypothetical protein
MPFRRLQMIAAVIGTSALAGVLIAAAPFPAGSALKPLPWGQAHYYEGCGGCHGLDGVSARREIPVLRDSVGAFLCSAEGRRYIIRLPNVAFAHMDDRTLADTMNFVVFELGRGSVPPGAKPYTAGEVASLRRSPLKNQPLARLRTAALAQGSEPCRAPAVGVAPAVSLR